MASVTEEQQQRAAVENAEKLHDWPPEVGLGVDISALSVFNKAQMQRSYDDWTPIDLIELARACKLISLIDEEFEQLVAEGVVIYGGRHGQTPTENPRGRAIATMNSTVNAILRRLGLTSMSVVDKRSQANRGKQEREARDRKAELDSHDGYSVPDSDLLN